MTVRLTPIESDNTPPAPTPSAPDIRPSEASSPSGRPLPPARYEGSTTDEPVGSESDQVDGIDVAGGPPPTPDEAPQPGHVPGVGGDPTGEDDPSSGHLRSTDDADRPEAMTDSRMALREARRIRRRTAWLCAAVVALALALTIAVVSLAKARPPQASTPVVTVSSSAYPIASAPAPAPGPWRSGV